MDSVRVLVEAEAGSNHRLVYDEATLEVSTLRRLPAVYPFAYGFIIGTTTDDGGAVDCYLITTEPVSAGSLLEVQLRPPRAIRGRRARPQDPRRPPGRTPTPRPRRAGDA